MMVEGADKNSRKKGYFFNIRDLPVLIFCSVEPAIQNNPGINMGSPFPVNITIARQQYN